VEKESSEMSCVGQRPGKYGPDQKVVIDLLCKKNCNNAGKEGALGCDGCYDWGNYDPKQQLLGQDPRSGCH
jgi:hypothetical protein